MQTKTMTNVITSLINLAIFTILILSEINFRNVIFLYDTEHSITGEACTYEKKINQYTTMLYK